MMKRLLFFLLLPWMVSCLDDEPVVCPDTNVASPYQDPIWHPSGNIIGFNHTPVKDIEIFGGGKCDISYHVTSKLDSNGYWLINSDGTNKRRISRSRLSQAAWSPDGTWIVYVVESDIYKIFFDGQTLDSASAIRLTYEGGNLSPVWNSDGSSIAYRNTNCGTPTEPKQPNSCGIITMRPDGTDKKLVTEQQGFHFWGKEPQFLFVDGKQINVTDGSQTTVFDFTGQSIAILSSPAFNRVGTKIGFVGQLLENLGTYGEFFVMDPDGNNLQGSDEPTESFSWSPDGKIVYVRFDGKTVDDQMGTLWTMNVDGSEKKQLTFNPTE